MNRLLTVKGKGLYLDNKPFKLRSGTIHYFRIHPSEWQDRLMKLKACGLNTVETYIAWNIQEPQRGRFNYEGIADFERFISIAEELELFVIVRPGPFICAEWEMGGFPSWLLNVEGINLRHDNEPYLSSVKSYFDAVIPRLIPHLSTNGGSIIAMQVENEFGGLNQPDDGYLIKLKDMLLSYGVDVLLFTSDGTWGEGLETGSIDNVLMTANFGSRAKFAYERIQSLRPNSPFICMEFWNGWFDQWGKKHHVRNSDGIIKELKDILDLDGHFNMYMFSGGTNFGFTNGSNCNPDFEPTITSYDYGAPVSEDGTLTEQYYLLRELLIKNDGIDPPPVPEVKPAKAYGNVELLSASVFDNLNLLGGEFKSGTPLTMEDVNQSGGYILYTIDVSKMSGAVDIGEPHDRAMFFGDGKYLGVHERGQEYDKIEISGISELKILVENMGRVNYGPRIYDKKGLISPVKIGGEEVGDYTINTLPMENVTRLPEKELSDEPMLYFGEFEVSETSRTYLYPSGFSKGIAFINGFNLGRYWSAGPQLTLYVPEGVLKLGKNELVILDLYPAKAPAAELLDAPILDSTGLLWT